MLHFQKKREWVQMNRYPRQIAMRAVTALIIALQQGSALCADSQALFTEDHVVLANGVAGKTVHIDSGNPRSYEEIIARAEFPSVRLSAKLFLPHESGRLPVVIIVPGSSGVRNSAIEHATALTSAEIAVLVVDPFGARSVTSTVADQGQFSFAASSYDVLAAAAYLATLPEIDRAHIGALGYSRGGTAVIQAAVAPLANAVLGERISLRAVAAAWPWCGYQFEQPETRRTAIRFFVGDLDAWASPIQCQGYAVLMKDRNPDVSIRVFRNAVHGFGNGQQLRNEPDAMTVLNAPITYINSRGEILDPYTGAPLPGIDPGALVKRSAPFLSRGARVGSQDDQAQQFVTDMVGFFQRQLAP
jgi:dienelactone hydrolase